MFSLVVFDFDDCIYQHSESYRATYSKSLDEVVAAERGAMGLEVLSSCREGYEGKGELALFALNIPFSRWAKSLLDLPEISPQLGLVEGFRGMKAYKVIYTGSPKRLVERTLIQLGFVKEDFNLVIGWEEPELFPVKWARSPLVFERILKEFGCNPKETLSVGDSWETDLAPASHLGISTVQIGCNSGKADRYFPTIYEFLQQGGIK